MGEFFRIIPEFRILRLTFHRSAFEYMKQMVKADDIFKIKRVNLSYGMNNFNLPLKNFYLDFI